MSCSFEIRRSLGRSIVYSRCVPWDEYASWCVYLSVLSDHFQRWTFNDKKISSILRTLNKTKLFLVQLSGHHHRQIMVKNRTDSLLFLFLFLSMILTVEQRRKGLGFFPLLSLSRSFIVERKKNEEEQQPEMTNRSTLNIISISSSTHSRFQIAIYSFLFAVFIELDTVM